MTDHPSVPDDLVYLLTTDHIGHVSWARRDGSLVGCLMWIDWDGEHLGDQLSGRLWQRSAPGDATLRSTFQWSTTTTTGATSASAAA